MNTQEEQLSTLMQFEKDNQALVDEKYQELAKEERYREEFDKAIFAEYNKEFLTEEFFKQERGHYYRYKKPLEIYLAARKASQEELKHWTKVHGEIIKSMNEERKQLILEYREEMEKLEAKNDQLKLEMKNIIKNEYDLHYENQKLKDFVKRAKLYLSHDKVMSYDEYVQWHKDTEEI